MIKLNDLLGRSARRLLANFPMSLASSRRPSQRGYAYLMALFMVVTLIIGSQVAMKNIVTEGRREREAEMIWRGQQYVRAIRLYYLKTGHYPSNLDDLKKGLPELHFLRYAAYKDPMKKDDAQWRLIYVNAAGQIIGSVKYATLQQMAIMDLNGGKIPGAKPGDQSDQNGQPGVPASGMADQSNASNANSSNPPAQNPPANTNSNPNQPPGAPGVVPDNSANAGVGPQNTTNTAQPPGSPSQGLTPGAASPNQNPNPQSASPNPTNAIGTPAGAGALTTQNNVSLAALAALKPTGPVDGPVVGGFLTGVGSTVDKRSIRIYNGAKKYSDWEFIWNPIEEQAQAMQQGLSNPQAGSLPGQPGQSIGGGPAGTSIFGNSGPGLNPGSSSPSPSPQAMGGSNPSQSSPTPQQ